jgi:hypothetical protein
MALYNEILPEFQKFGAELIRSIRGWSLVPPGLCRSPTPAFFPALDFEPKGAVARRYGAYRNDGQVSGALFVIDKDESLRWSYLSPIALNPGADGILEALEGLTKPRRSMANLKPPVTSEDHIQGPEDAPVTLVEYGDYECPHCGRAYAIIKRVQKHFGKSLRFVFRNFPLSELHPQAESAAETAEFAGARGKFWEMHDLLFENQGG